MSLPQLKHTGYTLEDWMGWEGRWELIDGVAYDMRPAPSTKHQEISSNLHATIWNALAQAKKKGAGGGCKIFPAPTDVYLESGPVQPDLVVVCDPAKISPRGIEGAPDLVVEILSPSTASKDMTRKRWAYEAAGIPEYLIVDPEERIAILLKLEGGRYQEATHVEWGAVLELLGGKLTVTLE